MSDPSRESEGGKNAIALWGCSPGKAPPGAWQRAEDGSEGQSREEGVEGEVEQALHPVIAQAFQGVNVVLGGNGRTNVDKKCSRSSRAQVFDPRSCFR